MEVFNSGSSKVYIFDLDDTLYLRKVDNEYKKMYEFELVKFLNKLKKNNILAIASHNMSPRYFLRNMNIDTYFDYIIGEYPRKKSDMIIEILKNVNKVKEDVIFFDDLDFNIIECKKNGIKSIKVDFKKGIEFKKFELN